MRRQCCQRGYALFGHGVDRRQTINDVERPSWSVVLGDRRGLRAMGLRIVAARNHRDIHFDAAFRLCRLLIRSSTTAGSANVEVSPSAPTSSSAILRRMRRMIFPERVFGRPGANWMTSGAAIGPISLRTQATSALRSSGEGSMPAIKVTYA